GAGEAHGATGLGRSDRQLRRGAARARAPGVRPGRADGPDVGARSAERVHPRGPDGGTRSEEHTSELQSRVDLVCRLLLEKKKTWRKSRRARRPGRRQSGGKRRSGTRLWWSGWAARWRERRRRPSAK